MDKVKEKITCECGAIIQRNSIPSHMKSSKHKGKPKPKAVINQGLYIVSFN